MYALHPRPEITDCSIHQKALFNFNLQYSCTQLSSPSVKCTPNSYHTNRSTGERVNDYHKTPVSFVKNEKIPWLKWSHPPPRCLQSNVRLRRKYSSLGLIFLRILHKTIDNYVRQFAYMIHTSNFLTFLHFFKREMSNWKLLKLQKSFNNNSTVHYVNSCIHKISYEISFKLMLWLPKTVIIIKYNILKIVCIHLRLLKFLRRSTLIVLWLDIAPRLKINNYCFF